MLWEKDPTEYAMRYLVDNRPARSPQPLAASVGSAFDAFVKANLHEALFGKGHDPEFELDALFESQVEKHNHDEAMAMGEHVYGDYVQTGAYDELLELMQDAQGEPRFEFDAGLTIGGVPMFGKPDCQFIHKSGTNVILDWKVKGYCSKYGASPSKGYSLCRDGADWVERNLTKPQLKKRDEGIEVAGKNSRSNGKEHDKYLAMDHHGITINQGYLETCNEVWATQLSIYSWLCGQEVGDENSIVCIDEIVCKFMGEGQKPLLRIGTHKARLSKVFQEQLFGKIKLLWETIQSNHLFADLSQEESESKFTMLQRRAQGMASDGSEEENWWSEMGRPAFR
jgi:hypothetical protein